MDYLQITSPNICALLFQGDVVTYLDSLPPTKIWPPLDYTGFEEFTSIDSAADRAKVVNPEFNVNTIYGPLTLVPVNISNAEISSYEGATVTLHCEYACADATVTYKWLNPGGLEIPGAATSELTIGNITPIYDGTYTCQVSASNAKGQTGSASGSFKVTVFPPFGGSAAG